MPEFGGNVKNLMPLGWSPIIAGIKQDGNVPSRRHILGSEIFKEQLLEIFGKKHFFSKNYF